MQKNSSQPVPAALNAEKAVLSVIFQRPDTHMTLALGEGLTAEHFHHASTRGLWCEITRLHEAKQEIELVSLTEGLLKSGQLDALGGPAEITGIYSYMPTAEHWSQHISILRDRMARRRMLKYAARMDAAASGDETPDTLAGMARDAAEAILDASSSSDGTKTAKEACTEFFDLFQDLSEGRREPGIPTGMDALDEVTGGMRPGELWVTAGPTSGGKSALAIQAATNAIKQKKRVGIFSLEMQAEENIARAISAGYGVDYTFLRDPRAKVFDPTHQQWRGITNADLKRIRAALSDLSESPLTICDEAQLTIERIEAIAQKWKDTSGLDVLVIDYVQIVRTVRKGEARHEELAWITESMKQLAKKLQCTVITGSQLNDEGKMSKARAIGENADVVLRIEGEDGIYVFKNRNGKKHMHLPLVLDGSRQKFVNAPNI